MLANPHPLSMIDLHVVLFFFLFTKHPRPFYVVTFLSHPKRNSVPLDTEPVSRPSAPGQESALIAIHIRPY